MYRTRLETSLDYQPIHLTIRQIVPDNIPTNTRYCPKFCPFFVPWGDAERDISMYRASVHSRKDAVR